MNAVAQSTKDTIDFFWTESHLQQFQHTWDNQDYDSTITVRIYQQQIEFKHWKTEAAVDADIEKLFQLARTGCNKTLNEGYQKIHDKWLARDNYDACDYLANAWDCISTAQCKLASRWGVYIEWSTIDDWSDD